MQRGGEYRESWTPISATPVPLTVHLATFQLEHTILGCGWFEWLYPYACCLAHTSSLPLSLRYSPSAKQRKRWRLKILPSLHISLESNSNKCSVYVGVGKSATSLRKTQWYLQTVKTVGVYTAIKFYSPWPRCWQGQCLRVPGTHPPSSLDPPL